MMSKNKTTTVILIAFLLSGCTLLDRAAGKTSASTPTLANMSVIQATATIELLTLTPTPTFSPSPNSMDTQIAADKDNANREIEAANIKLNAAHIEQTNVADNKTLVADQKTTVANIIVGTTTQLVIVGTNDEANRQFLKVVPTLTLVAIKNSYAGATYTSEIAMNWGIGLGVAFVGLTLLVAITTSRRRPPVETPAQEADTSEPVADEMKEWERSFAPVSKNGMGLQLAPPGNQKHFLEFALAVCSGRKGFAKTEWYGADSPYTRDTYNEVYNWLWKFKLVELPAGGKIRWTVEGQGWVDNWIEKNLLTDLPSPTDSEVPISTDSTAEISQAAENQGAESARGVVLHEEAPPTAEPTPEPEPEMK